LKSAFLFKIFACVPPQQPPPPEHQTAAHIRKLVNEERLKVLLISQTPNQLRYTKACIFLNIKPNQHY
ncbi:MAG: hypothetical protein LBV67_00245, partial [Streptococcaceae bacterium]|nr:hypothetical protein [Streptococcaceae bacterium]